jgi:hypothetical protein
VPVVPLGAVGPDHSHHRKDPTVPERVYMNRRPGEENIHVKFTYGEIRELLARPTGEAARQLWQVINAADRKFDELDPAPEMSDADAERFADECETAAEHSLGKHDHCGPTCETAFPGDQLRNFILAKGYPGTAGMLDELLRRAAEGTCTPTMPCSLPNPCEDGELCARHEREKAHAEGEHAFCGPECEGAEA